jgi:HK97 family phage major capsid protein
MSIKETILNGIKESYQSGRKVDLNLKEAAGLTGSGSGVGGNVVFDQAFSNLRQINPFRRGARQITVRGSDAQFVAKTGNATYQTNPWGYPVQNNTGTPSTSTSIWQLPVRAVTAQLPIRMAALEDINYIEETIVNDVISEFSQVEGASMAINVDQAGSSTTSTGATSGLRGLDGYTSASASAFGTSGTAITNGLHSIATVSNGGVAVTYNKVVSMAFSLPPQYWYYESTAWHMTPTMILTLRQLKDTSGLPLFIEVGDGDADGAVGKIFGFPVIPNPYLSDAFPIYLANWSRFLTIGDTEEMSIQKFEQTQAGFMTMYFEKRVVSTVLDPFAGVRMSAA